MTIEINIKSNRRFLDVAVVVDRQDFQKEIEQIRTDLAVPYPMDNDQVTQFIRNLYIQKKEKQFYDRLEDGRKKLRLNILYKKVIRAAILYNKISNADYKAADLIHSLDPYNEEEGEVSEIYSIVISPNTQDQDVLDILKEYRSQIDKDGYDQPDEVEGVKGYKYISSIWGKEKDKPSIKKYRRWYLAVKSGAPYQDICNEEMNNCPLVKRGITHITGKGKPTNCSCYDESAIRHGVITYKKLIRKTPTF